MMSSGKRWARERQWIAARVNTRTDRASIAPANAATTARLRAAITVTFSCPRCRAGLGRDGRPVRSGEGERVGDGQYLGEPR